MITLIAGIVIGWISAVFAVLGYRLLAGWPARVSQDAAEAEYQPPVIASQLLDVYCPIEFVGTWPAERSN